MRISWRSSEIPEQRGYAGRERRCRRHRGRRRGSQVAGAFRRTGGNRLWPKGEVLPPTENPWIRPGRRVLAVGCPGGPEPECAMRPRTGRRLACRSATGAVFSCHHSCGRSLADGGRRESGPIPECPGQPNPGPSGESGQAEGRLDQCRTEVAALLRRRRPPPATRPPGPRPGHRPRVRSLLRFGWRPPQLPTAARGSRPKSTPSAPPTPRPAPSPPLSGRSPHRSAAAPCPHVPRQ